MTLDSDSIFFAVECDGKGGAVDIPHEQIEASLSNQNLTWVHFDASPPQTEQWLKKEAFDLDPVIISALLDEETRPRMLQFDDSALLILRGANLNKHSDPEDMVSIRLWITKQKIISIQRRKLKAIWDIKSQLNNKTGPLDAGSFAYALTSQLLKRIAPALIELDDTLDGIEEEVLDHANTSLRESITEIRKTAILFKRYLNPQKEAINQLQQSPLSWLKTSHRQYLKETHNHIVRHIEDLETIRERTIVIKDELTNLLSTKLNENLYVLSIITAIFLPLSFLTGLFGVNLGGIPGATTSNAFYLFTITLGVLFILQIIAFIRKKWL